MQDKEVINILQKQLNFTSKSIKALKIFGILYFYASIKFDEISNTFPSYYNDTQKNKERTFLILKYTGGQLFFRTFQLEAEVIKKIKT